MLTDNCPTSAYYLEDDYGYVGPATVSNVNQIYKAMDVYEQSLKGCDIDACRNCLLELHRVINGAAKAGLIDNVDVFHKLTADILKKASPSTSEMAEYIKLQLETEYRGL